MEWAIEILKMSASAVAGGGALWLFNLRRRVRRDANQIEGEDFDLVSKTVKQAMSDLASLSERIGDLEKEKIAILNRIGDLERENEKLQRENKHLETVLRDYIQEKNPGLRKK